MRARLRSAWRGCASLGGGNWTEAPAIELFTRKDLIADVSFVGLARNYEKVGQPCDAAAAIESCVANPSRHETAQTRSIIAAYERKGNCASATAGMEEVFARPRRGEVVTLPVTINGVQGRFILDTGASFVSLKSSFAAKAKVEIDQDSKTASAQSGESGPYHSPLALRAHAA